MFRIKFNVSTLERKYRLASNLTDEKITEALKAFTAWKRKRIKEAFNAEGPGWAPLAPSTDKKLTHTVAGQVTKGGKLKKGTQRRILKAYESMAKRGKIPETMVAEAKSALASGGELPVPGRQKKRRGLLSRVLGSKPAEEKRKKTTLEKLKERVAKTQAKGPSKKRALAEHKMLGGLSSSIKADIKRSTVVIYSKVPWAGVHNDGGVNGKGAQIPRRTFLAIDDADVQMLSTLLEAELEDLTNG